MTTLTWTITPPGDAEPFDIEIRFRRTHKATRADSDSPGDPAEFEIRGMHIFPGGLNWLHSMGWRAAMDFVQRMAHEDPALYDAMNRAADEDEACERESSWGV